MGDYSPSWAPELLARVEAAVARPVRRLETDIDLDRFFSRDRRQYNATLVLAALLQHLPNGDAHIVGITRHDLFIPVLTFVFGQAQLDGPGAVVSTLRLHNEYYGLPPDRTLLVDRAVKEVVHELGHSFGLVHCEDYACVMSASMSVEDVDLKQARFCSACRALLSASDARGS
jgi:archaemetzincin